MKQKLTLIFEDDKSYRDYRRQFKSAAEMDRQVKQDGVDFAKMLEELYHSNGADSTKITCQSAKAYQD